MTKCMWCATSCIEVPNGNEFLLKTHAWCIYYNGLVPKAKN